MDEPVNLKVEELKSEMSKEVAKIKKNYATLHDKVDVIADAIKKLVEYYTSITTKLDAKTETYSKVFAKMEEFLGGLKESISKIDTFHSSLVSQESTSKMISFLETNIKVELAPILKLVNLTPTDAPPVKQVAQGGNKGVGSSKDLNQGKVVGKVMTM